MIVSNPINAIVPFAAEVLRKNGAFDARRLFGITSLDVVRAETFLAEMLDKRSELGTGALVDVIGGHSAETMIPLFGQVEEAKTLTSAQVDNLIFRKWIQLRYLLFGRIGWLIRKTPFGAARRCSSQRRKKGPRLCQQPTLFSGTASPLYLMGRNTLINC